MASLHEIWLELKSWRTGELKSRELGSQERRVIAFCVAEFKWKWIQYCIFTPKCFQKQIFHLHFLNGAIRITCPTGPKHWFCSCAMKGESRIPRPSHSPFRPPVAQRTRQPFHLPKKKKKKRKNDGHWQYIAAKVLRILNALCGTKDSLSHTFSVPFLGKLINNVREIKGKSISMLRGIQRAQSGFHRFFHVWSIGLYT